MSDPFAWLVARNTIAARKLALLGWLAGPLALGLFAYQMTVFPWWLSARDPVTTRLGGGCAPLGAVYEIEVQGVSYVCGGGDKKCAPQRNGGSP